MADALDQLRTAADEQGMQLGFARRFVVRGELHLDQLVMGKGDVEFGADRLGQAMLAETHDRLQRVCSLTQLAQRSLVEQGRCRIRLGHDVIAWAADDVSLGNEKGEAESADLHSRPAGSAEKVPSFVPGPGVYVSRLD